MLRTLLVWGLLAGVCAGLLATGFASVAGEPHVDAAIALEPPSAEPELVGRDVQKSVGLLTASVVYGLALGGIFAIVFAVVYGRVGRASPAQTALLLALGAFVVVFLVPFLKYPANPPATGDPETIGQRTELYLLMVSISVLAAIAALRLRPRVGSAAAVATYVAVVAVAAIAMPGVDEIPRGFPADTLWDFRLASVGMQAVLWAGIGAVFAPAARRALERR